MAVMFRLTKDISNFFERNDIIRISMFFQEKQNSNFGQN